MKKLLTMLMVVSIGFSASAAALDAEAGFNQPETFEANTTVDNQHVNFQVNGVSTDGDTDMAYFIFPETVELAPNNVDSNISISSSSTLVDRNGDGHQETVRAGISRDDESNTTTANLTLDTAVTYPEEGDVEVTLRFEDSEYGNTTASTQIQMQQDSESSNETEDQSTETDTTEQQDEQQTEQENTESTTESDDSSTTEDPETSTEDSENSSEETGIISGIVSFFTGLF